MVAGSWSLARFVAAVAVEEGSTAGFDLAHIHNLAGAVGSTAVGFARMVFITGQWSKTCQLDITPKGRTEQLFSFIATTQTYG